ncbi:helix-turn-helix domain-containing protein [Abiotrophia sp.]|jgi:hypothetical protein|uniref:helix-turn-helix domain-containing protein n=2 Tax=unclassified Abiotrophia TaxID=2608917 RepID=UPI001CB4FE44|nr:helix-turn-helix domain-containing protein [Abiotrophia sp.]MBF0942272.1 helix-turn-helix domain-containing protein [Abiotrophia sp.]
MHTQSDALMSQLADYLWENYAGKMNDLLATLSQRVSQLEASQHKAYLTQHEVMETFGIGHRTLKTWVANGLPEIWLGNRVYYDRNDLQHYMETQKI